MSNQMTLLASLKPTSSPVPAAGPLLSTLPDGLEADRSGRVVVHVSPFPPPAYNSEKLTQGTFGPSFTGSSRSACLQQSLANRLAENLEGLGSPLYDLTWKRSAMKSGPPICRLAASARRISVSVFFGGLLSPWATATATEAGGTAEQGLARKVGKNCGQSVTILSHQAQLTHWPTPLKNDHKDSTLTAEYEEKCASKHHLAGIAHIATHGLRSSGSTAETGKPDQFNPDLPRWLQGYPTTWDASRAMETP